MSIFQLFVCVCAAIPEPERNQFWYSLYNSSKRIEKSELCQKKCHIFYLKCIYDKKYWDTKTNSSCCYCSTILTNEHVYFNFYDFLSTSLMIFFDFCIFSSRPTGTNKIQNILTSLCKRICSFYNHIHIYLFITK